MTWPAHRTKWHDQHIKWHDMTGHVPTNHSSSPHVTSQPSTLLHLTPQATSWHQNRSHHHHGTAEGSFTAKTWFGHRAGRSPCAHSIGKFFLWLIVFFFETSAPGLSGHYWYACFTYPWAFWFSLFLSGAAYELFGYNRKPKPKKLTVCECSTMSWAFKSVQIIIRDLHCIANCQYHASGYWCNGWEVYTEKNDCREWWESTHKRPTSFMWFLPGCLVERVKHFTSATEEFSVWSTTAHHHGVSALGDVCLFAVCASDVLVVEFLVHCYWKGVWMSEGLKAACAFCPWAVLLLISNLKGHATSSVSCNLVRKRGT